MAKAKQGGEHQCHASFGDLNRDNEKHTLSFRQNNGSHYCRNEHCNLSQREDPRIQVLSQSFEILAG